MRTHACVRNVCAELRRPSSVRRELLVVALPLLLNCMRHTIVMHQPARSEHVGVCGVACGLHAGVFEHRVQTCALCGCTGHHKLSLAITAVERVSTGLEVSAHHSCGL